MANYNGIWKNDTGELSEGEMSHGFYEGRRLKALISSLFLVLLLRPCLSVSNESSSKIKWLRVRESMRSCRTAVHGEAGVVVSIAYESAGKDKQKECIEVHSSPSWTNTKKKTQVGAAGRIFRFVIPENMNSVLIVEGNLENRLYRVSRFSGRTGEGAAECISTSSEMAVGQLIRFRITFDGSWLFLQFYSW